MKISRTLYNKAQLDALEEQGIVFDFDKDYSDAELSDFEDAIGDAVLDCGFVGGKPNDKCAFWEKIIDDFVDSI